MRGSQLFAYFTGEGTANGEQVYAALSDGNDPLAWNELNGAQPILTSDQGEGGVRDPFVIRSPEGDRFYRFLGERSGLQAGGESGRLPARGPA